MAGAFGFFGVAEGRGLAIEALYEQSRCGKKNQRVCTQAHTLISVDACVVE